MTVPAWLLTLPVAHRGLHAPAAMPENTLGAFAAAVEGGYAIELDVGLSRDGVPMAFHDTRMERLTALKGRLAEWDAAELRRTPVLASAETVPTLDDVLAEVAGAAPLLIELKGWADRPAVLAEAVWARLRRYGGELAVQSFNPACMAWFRVHAPQVCRGQIAGGLGHYTRHSIGPWLAFRLSRLQLNHVSGPHFVAYDVRALPCHAVARVSRSLPVICYTVRTPADERRARRYADNIIFEGFRP